MDYKKITLYTIIILVGIGVWYKSKLDEGKREEEIERFAHVYASTTVMAELYRNEPEKFFVARDSILNEYDVDTVWLNRFQSSFDSREENWTMVFIRIQNIADSLVEYFKENPIEHDKVETGDSLKAPDSL